MEALPRTTLAALAPEARVELWNRAYEGYVVPARFDGAQVRRMTRLGDLDEAHSPVLLHAGEPVAFGALGLRGQRAWLGGFGVASTHRRRGIGGEALAAWFEHARARGARHASLEVLEPNEGARALYLANGFREARWLEVWKLERAGAEDSPSETRETSVGEALDLIDRIDGPPEPWQREAASVRNVEDEATGLRLGPDDDPLGAAIVRLAPGGVSVLRLRAAGGAERPARIRSLLAAALARAPGGALRWINVAADDPASAVLREVGATLEIRQVEMSMRL